MEWQENVPESEESRDQAREEKSAMALRMAQIEEEREGELLYFQYNNPVFMDLCVSVVLQTELIAHHSGSSCSHKGYVVSEIAEICNFCFFLFPRVCFSYIHLVLYDF